MGPPLSTFELSFEHHPSHVWTNCRAYTFSLQAGPEEKILNECNISI